MPSTDAAPAALGDDCWLATKNSRRQPQRKEPDADRRFAKLQAMTNTFAAALSF
jgi:hypothetical protein